MCRQTAYRRHKPRILRGRVIGPVLLIGVAALVADAQPYELVSFEVAPQSDTGRVRVQATWLTRGRTASAIYASPRWGTVQNVPALIRELEFAGDVTSVEPKGTRWLLRHPRDGTVSYSYEVEPGRRELDWESAHYPVTTKTFFHGFGDTFLITPQSGGGLPEVYNFTLRWVLPPGWDAVCSWGKGRSVGAPLAPADLRNSSYLAGEIVVRTVERDGLRVTVALRDRFRFDADEFAKLATTIVEQECRFMGEQSFPPFVVVAVPIGLPINAGDTRLMGMGLYNSFTLLAAPGSTLTDAFEHLFAHELFHYWNGRLLKAEPPDKLVYWFVEGFTDYYALRILYESGHWTPEVYCKWINRHLREYHNNPAVHATNQEIAERYWKERDTVGEVAYQRGLLLGLRWHRLARQRGVPDGLDRLFKTLVERGRRGGFEVSNDTIRQAGIELLGAWFAEELDRFVARAETVDVPADALAPELIGTSRRVHSFELGFDASATSRARRIRGLVARSEAEKAGLREGDEVVAAKTHRDPDQQIELTVRRQGKLQTVRYYPRGEPTYVLQFEPARANPRVP